jgi:hypothetical protein
VPDTITNTEDIEIVDPALDEPFIDDGDEPFFPAEAAAEETPVETPAAEAVATPAPVAHPPELLERAAVLQIPADEVASMTPDQLRQVIKHADRIGKTVYDSLTQKPVEPAPAPAPAKAVVVDEFAVFDDPEKYDPEFIKPVKAVLVKQAEENRILRERLEKLESKTGQTEAQALHSRLMVAAAELSPEVAKVFDLSTTTGKAKYAELLDQMGASHRHNKTLSEKQLLARAVKAMELLPETPKPAAPKPEISEERWGGAALGKPTVRKSTESDVDKVGKILAAARSKPVNGVAGK